MFKKMIFTIIIILSINIIAYAQTADKLEIKITPVGDYTILEDNGELFIYIDEEEKLEFLATSLYGSGSTFKKANLSYKKLPEGFSYSKKKKLFKWIPQDDQSGSYKIEFSSKYWRYKTKLIVNIIVDDNVFTIKKDELFKRTFRAFDIDGHDVDIQSSCLPDGATFEGDEFGDKTLTWIPTWRQTGIHYIRIEVWDYPKDAAGEILEDMQKKDVRYIKMKVEE